MTDVERITAEPRSDQWNADDFVGGARVFTIAGVKPGGAEQKYDIELAEGQGRFWRPPLTVLRLLIDAWGDHAKDWVGRRVELYRDPSVTFGRDSVGGIRISRLSHLPDGKPLTVNLTVSRGKREKFTVQPLAAPAALSPDTLAKLTAEFVRVGVPGDKRLAGANHYAGANAGALDELTEDQAQTVLGVLADRPDAQTAADETQQDEPEQLSEPDGWQQ